MKKTLLEVCQDMLAAIDAENVTDVGETEEADMCVRIANRVFEQIAVSKRWKHFKGFTSLTTQTNKNEMGLPTGMISLDSGSVYYDDEWVRWMEPEDFLYMTIRRNTDETNIEKVNGIKVYNDRNPTWYTSDDNETFRFDAFNTTNLVQSKSNVFGHILPVSLVTDAAAFFDFPAVVYPALVEYCVGRAMLELQQNAEGRGLITEAKKMLSKTSRTSRLVDGVGPDRRKWIVPRRSYRRFASNEISFVS